VSESPVTTGDEIADHQVIIRGGQVEAVVVPLEEYRALKAQSTYLRPRSCMPPRVRHWLNTCAGEVASGLLVTSGVSYWRRGYDPVAQASPARALG
jgi:hypothetical protein